MTHPDLNRRRALKLFAGAPLLPIATTFGGGMTLSLAACGGSDDATVTATRFTGMTALTLDQAAAMATTTVASQMVQSMSDKTERTSGYQPFFVTGDLVPDGAG